MEQPIISGVAHDRSEANITVAGVPDKVGAAARIFRAVAAAGINIDMIVQSISAGHRAGRHLLHAAAPGRAGGDDARCTRSRTRSASSRWCSTTGSARSR